MGILTILATISTVALNYLKTGQLPDIAPTFVALGAGWGLIWANDPKSTGGSSGSIAPLVAIFAMLSLSACAWEKAHQTQIIAVGKVALQHIAKDVLSITASALVNQAQSGFNGDYAASLTQGAYSLTPEILSSGNLQDYLDAWNPVAPTVNAAIAKSVSAAIPTKQIQEAMQDPGKAKALASQIGVTVGNAVLAANGQLNP